MKNRNQEIKFEPDMPDVPNVQWTNEGAIFHIHAKPIKFGPYNYMAEARKAFYELKKKLEDHDAGSDGEEITVEKLEDHDAGSDGEEITVEKLAEIVARLHRFCITHIMVPPFARDKYLCMSLLEDGDLLSRFMKGL